MTKEVKTVYFKKHIIKYLKGTVQITNVKTGISYILQCSLKDLWKFPKKEKTFRGGRYTLYGWLCFYFGISNINFIDLRETIARIYNEDRQKGLKLMQKFMKENSSNFQKLQIQQDNIDRNCHVAPEMYKKDILNMLTLYGYKCDENLNIVSYYDILLEK